MQRITRDSSVHAPELLTTLDDKVRLLQRYFPPSVASLFATPRQGEDGTLQWWSGLGGQPLPYNQLDAGAGQALLARYEQRQAAIAQLIEALEQRGNAQEVQMLRSLQGAPDLDNLYSLNQEPVVVRWGIPPLTSEVSGTPSMPPPTTPEKNRRRWFFIRLSRWWLLLPLLPLLLWLLWGWRGYLWHLINPRPVGNFACHANATPPDFVVVLDTSGSMNLNIGISKEDETWINEIGGNLPDNNPRKSRLMSEPTRLTAAKQAFDSMLERLHPAIDLRLITFQGCEATIDRGLFATSQRNQLRQEVHQLGAASGTPLAASLEQAASLVDGRFKDAVVVMFVDGEDGCGQNACELSKRIAQKQPRLRVNVVNISDSNLSNCVAENTGGRVYAARNINEVQRMLQDASEEVASDPACPGADVP
ncbi:MULTISPECIES: VWA domain-containing protein [Pseudomonas]|uniref:VWFA domain-containing protein n=1 Tax=Pseudomonas citronellolis TaxID=53408 RepID=A0A1A9KH39_9PSED|nr:MULTISPECIES: VWA domain-containing protein [Pseudomonas]ANI16303.1 hypothetical protein A9C11_21040 [Pseudomonas citronellolis]EJU9614655.1 VWA domain-containing protein [Pseudomonas aeruginosa]EKU2928212.1 VWA domain-containing protein [Pseudomonas aeruginosa]ELM0223525.1 VWA domain-containing protein [Pseudomonas aeruginosa]KSN11651.1 VWA domain-containing protein [Pseudomonas aeruginosa]